MEPTEPPPGRLRVTSRLSSRMNRSQVEETFTCHSTLGRVVEDCPEAAGELLEVVQRRISFYESHWDRVQGRRVVETPVVLVGALEGLPVSPSGP